MSGKTQLPVGWEHCQLGEIVSVIRGVSYSKDQSTSSPKPDFVPILRATNINRSLDFEELVYVEPQCVSSEQFLRNGDIVIAASSGSKAVVGKAAHFEGAWVGSFGAFCMGLRPCELVESRYVGYFLQSDEYRHRVSDLSAGSNINNLKRDHIQSFPFRIAPISEQHRIVAKIEELFSDLDAGVAALNRAKANLTRYRAAVLKAAVEGKLTEEWRAKHPAKEPAWALLERILKERRRKWEADQLAKFAAAGKQPPKNWREKYVEPSPPDTTGLPQLPNGWCWASVEQVTSLVTKGSSPGWQGFEYCAEGVPFVRSQNIRWGALDLDEVVYLPKAFNDTHQSSILSAGDVLLNLVGASIGRAAVATEEVEGANTNQAVGIIRPIKGSISSQLLVQILLSPMLQSYIGKTKADVARANFNLDDVRPTPIPLPLLEEQEIIATEVAEALSQIESAENAIEHDLLRASRLRQSILKQAFEGKLVPQDPKDEPASVLLERLRASQADQDTKSNSKSNRRPTKQKKSERMVDK